MSAAAVLHEHEAVAAFLAARSEACFSDLVRYLTPRLLRYFEVRGCDPQAAEEMTQDVLLACYRHSGSIRHPQAFGAWLYRVARNVLLQGVRKRKREVATMPLDSLRGEARGTPRFGEAEFADLVAGLGEEEKELIALRYLDGYGYEEIGALLNIPAGTAKWRVFNAKWKMLDRLPRSAHGV